MLGQPFVLLDPWLAVRDGLGTVLDDLSDRAASSSLREYALGREGCRANLKSQKRLIHNAC
jgi:hypothetical protein